MPELVVLCTTRRLGFVVGKAGWVHTNGQGWEYLQRNALTAVDFEGLGG